jgi:hypothetical protein
MAIEQIRKDWYAGKADGHAGRRAEPGARDRLSYMSGWIEGKAQRERERAAAHDARQPQAD